MDVVLDAGAEDINSQDEGIEVLTEPHNLTKVRSAIEGAGITIDLSEVTHIPGNTVKITEAQIEEIEKLVENLEDHEDVQKVTTNLD
jgi:transcriptional/translational regulatory protein YebC/TACO1